MRKYEEEHYKYENIKEKIYPWVKSELTDSQALNGKHISEKDTLVVSFMEDLSVIFVIKRGEDVFEVLKDNMLPPDCDIEELYHASCENLIRDVEFVIANTWYGGFGIIADGHHEASALCRPRIPYYLLRQARRWWWKRWWSMGKMLMSRARIRSARH